MKLGYVLINKEEQTKVLQVLKLTSESVALDELGIGRIRDAFADLMFPGVSTLQKHIKYFSLMPQLYKKASQKKYNRISEVKSEIIRLEKILTKNLYDGSSVKTGITGSDVIRKNQNVYVKYDPAYIYNSGLQTFEILRSPNLYELIYATSKALHQTPQKLIDDNDEFDNDANEHAGIFQFCSFPCVDYDFTNSCSLDLTAEDKNFIIAHILSAKACRGTLFRYLIENLPITIADRFSSIPSSKLPLEIARVYDNAKGFADFIYMVHLRYNYIFSGWEDKEIKSEFAEELNRYQESNLNIDEVLNNVVISENSSKDFCKDIARYIANDDYKELDDCIIKREVRVKGSRRKIGNPNFSYSPQNRIHYYKLNYRWETVKVFLDELRKGGANG